MAIASVGSLGSNNNKTAGTDVVITTTATLEAGNLAVVCVAYDNVATADGASTNIDTVTDSASNTYTKVAEYTETAGAAADGVTTAVFYTVATSQLASGGTITVSGDTASVAAKAATAWEYTIDEAAVAVADEVVSQAHDAEPADAALSGLTSREYLWVHAMGQENTNVTITQTNWTAFTTAFTPGGGSQTNVQIGGGFQITTATGITATVSTNADTGGHAYILAAIYEVAGGGDITVTPDVGIATLSGTTPVVAHVAAPAASVVTLATNAPTVAVAAAPAASLVTLTGIAPTTTVTAVQSAVAVVTLLGFDATIDAGGDVTVLPDVGTVTLAGLAPTVTVTAAPGAATMALSGLAPTLLYSTDPSVGTLTLSALVPTFTDFSIGLTFDPATPGSLTFAAATPGTLTFAAATPGSLVFDPHDDD